MVKSRRAVKMAVRVALTGVFASVFVFVGAGSASAHGYVSGNGVVARAAMTANVNRGPVEYEPWSLEAPKGFPAAGPADGQIASAGGKFGGNLDEQSSTRWVKNPVQPGPQQLNWTFTAPHATTEWRYYLTKQGWNQNAPLARSSFELIQTIKHDGSAASNNPSHTVTIPSNRSGYHVMLAVWDIADTPNAFYNVIDLDISGTPPPADTQAPTVPAGLNASATSSTVALSWSQSTDNVGVSGYDVYRNGTRLATTAATNFADTGLTPNTTYSYRVRALDGSGNASAQSQAVSVTTTSTPATDTTAPSVPDGLHSHDVTSNSAQIMWNASTDEVGVTAYEVFRGSTRVATTSSTSFNDTGLAPGTSYAYQVRALDAAGNASAKSSIVSVTTLPSSAPDTQAPSVPTGVRSTAKTASTVSLAWNASTDNFGVTSYEVFRGTTRITTTSSTSFVDTGRAANTSYSYQVRALDAAGNASAKSAAISVTTSATSTPDGQAPSAPGNLVSTAATASSVSLAWSASTDNVGVVRYDIWRGVGTGALSKIGTSSTPAFADINVGEKTTYRYQVRAYDAAGNSSSSSILGVTTPAASSVRVWSPFGDYTEGEIVTHLGNTYRALQDYTGEGDPNWIYADSLWVRL